MIVARQALAVTAVFLAWIVMAILAPAQTYARSPACPFVTELVVLGLLPAVDAEETSLSKVLCGASSDSMVSVGVTSVTPPTPPPLPAPGSGSLHLVTQRLTRTVTQTGSAEAISLGSLTITEKQDAMGYRLDMALALTASSSVSVAACSAASAGGQPWQVQYPAALGRGAFEYPTAGAFLQRLAADGYIDTGAVDVAHVPTATEPTDLWGRQPTFSEVLGSAAPPGVAATLVPGTLYVNLVLSATAGAPQWEVREWNYAFSVHARLADLCPQPQQKPPRQEPPQQPRGTPPAGGQQPSRPPASGRPPAVPCDAPGACPAVLTCGGGIACPLLHPLGAQHVPADTRSPDV